jgi:hypothetical protein
VFAEPSTTATMSPRVGQPASCVSCAHRGAPGTGPPNEELDGRRDDRRVVDDLPAVFGMLRVRVVALEGVGDRVEAGDEEQEPDVENSSRELALDLASRNWLRRSSVRRSRSSSATSKY